MIQTGEFCLMSKTQFEMAQDQHTTQIEAQNTLLAIRFKHIPQKN